MSLVTKDKVSKIWTINEVICQQCIFPHLLQHFLHLLLDRNSLRLISFLGYLD